MSPSNDHRGDYSDTRLDVAQGYAAAIDLNAVPGIGAEIVLTVDGELRKSRLFRSHEQAELAGAIANARATLGEEGLA